MHALTMGVARGSAFFGSFLLTAGLVVTPVMASADQCVHGNGEFSSATRQIGEIDSIDADGAFTIGVVSNKGGELTLKGESNILPVVVTRVTGKTLRLTLSKGVCTNGPIEIRVPMAEPRQIVASGTNEISGDGISSNSLSVRLDGSNSARLAGMVDRLEVAIAGSSSIDALDLRAQSVSVKVTGAGEVTVHAEDTLDVSIMGAGTVNYAGRPKQITRNIMGVGTIAPLD